MHRSERNRAITGSRNSFFCQIFAVCSSRGVGKCFQDIFCNRIALATKDCQMYWRIHSIEIPVFGSFKLKEIGKGSLQYEV